MKGMTLNSLPAGILGGGMAPGGAPVSPIKKRRKRMAQANKLNAAKGGGMQAPGAQLPFGGMMNK